ncbi:hypothetical protein [Trinickia acidisoli]|uniref:hypothetical protein n=1 Tax=Trinickia acidisoli TaxID=2767482 RepID=UPI001A905774|nr:hypothetical protein [Trinickia acidisoli]
MIAFRHAHPLRRNLNDERRESVAESNTFELGDFQFEQFEHGMSITVLQHDWCDLGKQRPRLFVNYTPMTW